MAAHWPCTWDEGRLAGILWDVVRGGDGAVIHDRAYLQALGYEDTDTVDVGTLWRHLLDHGAGDAVPREAVAALDLITSRGCLARRITRAAGPDPDRARLAEVYRRLSDCLAAGILFDDRG